MTLSHFPDGRSMTPVIPSVLLATDVVAFGTHYRDTPAQAKARHHMYQCLKVTFTLTGLPWAHCYVEDRGDGVLIVAPPIAPADHYLDPMLHQLNAVLRHGNRETGSRLRMRIALHYGPVHFDDYGVTGPDTLLLFRLLEARTLKKAVSTTDADLAAIISDAIFRDATDRDALIDRHAYRPTTASHKEARHIPAWLWCPNQPCT